MKIRSFMSVIVFSFWLVTPGFAVDGGIGSTAFSCDVVSNTCKCKGFVDCNAMKDKGVCSGSNGAQLICCELDGSSCSCTMGDASRCPANKKPFDPRSGVGTSVGTTPKGSLSSEPRKPSLVKPKAKAPRKAR